MWKASDIFRFVLTLALVALCGYCLVAKVPVPDWLQTMTALAVGNTFRLQPSRGAG